MRDGNEAGAKRRYWPLFITRSGEWPLLILGVVLFRFLGMTTFFLVLIAIGVATLIGGIRLLPPSHYRPPQLAASFNLGGPDHRGIERNQRRASLPRRGG
jgi:hypothetical protein